MAKTSRQGQLPLLDPETPGQTAASAVDDEPRTNVPAASMQDRLEGKTVWVVDSHSLIFQVFHAIPEMTSPRGEPVAAVFGFTRDILYLLDEKKPDYLFCAFDLSGPTFRHEMFDDYKLQRSEMPVDLRPQILSIQRVLDAIGVPRLECEACEADDILATIARVTEQRGGECFLVTGDKDCRQLITERVKVFNIRKNIVFDAVALEAEWGIRPEQVIDFQALVGDSVDNIPGVPGVGPKTARDLLQKYGSLEQIFAHVDELPAGKRKQLVEGRDKAAMSRELVKLKCDVPVPIDWNSGRTALFQRSRALPLFQEFGFHSLAAKLSTLEAPAASEVARTPSHCRVIDNLAELPDLVRRLAGQREIGMDVQTAGLSPRSAEIVGFSFSWLEGDTYVSHYLPVRAPQGEAHLDVAVTLSELKAVLEDGSIEKIGHDLKYDAVVLRSHGIRLTGMVFDSMLASYLLDAGERNHHLDELATRYLGQPGQKLSDLLGSGKMQRTIHQIPVLELVPCAAQGSELPLRLRPILLSKMEEAALTRLYSELEMPLVDVLAELEYSGIKVDVDLLTRLSQRYGERLDTLEHEIYSLAGRPFNIGSPKQLQEVLFTEQKLPVIKKTKTGASTDVEVLEELAKQHPLPAKIIEYRQYAKLKNTYVDALPQMVHADTGRVHATFNQVVAATGRLSCTDPNLQNIPIRHESGREIRAAFLPGEAGWKLLAGDYSQIELRVLAHFSGDESLRESFARDEDIHARVASQVYGVPLDAVTSAMRRVAKAVNFGVIYGQSPFGLAKTIDIEQSEAAEFIHAYFRQYRGVERFLEEILEACRRNGYVSTILGRRRSITGVRDRLAARGADASHQRNLSERTAINTVIQGSAADLIKLAMVHVRRRLDQERLSARMLLQIHDELIFEVPSEELSVVARLVADEMASAVPLSVPIKVDLKTGSNWADCEPW